MNNRRKLLVALGACALAASAGPFAQPPAAGMHRIGFLGSSLAKGDASELAALRAGLRELGYVEGKNLAIETRLAEGKYDRFPDLAAELVRLKVEVIVTQGPQATSAAQQATATIPIVMANSDDPVASNFVKSLAHPGGNITGLSNLSGEIGAKHLEMLLGMVPKLSRVAVLLNPANASSGAIVLKSVQSVAGSRGVKVLPIEARSAAEIETAFARMRHEKAGAVILVQDAVFQQQRTLIAELAVKHRLPTIFRNRQFAEAGGLISYGPTAEENFRRAATYVGKILRGAKPGDIPVEQPTNFRLVINGRTAKTLGLIIPQSLLIGADNVIE